MKHIWRIFFPLLSTTFSSDTSFHIICWGRRKSETKDYKKNSMCVCIYKEKMLIFNSQVLVTSFQGKKIVSFIFVIFTNIIRFSSFFHSFRIFYVCAVKLKNKNYLPHKGICIYICTQRYWWCVVFELYINFFGRKRYWFVVRFVTCKKNLFRWSV